MDWVSQELLDLAKLTVRLEEELHRGHQDSRVQIATQQIRDTESLDRQVRELQTRISWVEAYLRELPAETRQETSRDLPNPFHLKTMLYNLGHGARLGLLPPEPLRSPAATRLSITGAVTFSSDGSPLEDTHLSLFDGQGFYRGNTTTGPDGTYSFHALPQGLYFLHAGKNQYANELYDDIPCLDAFSGSLCESTGGRPIVVSGQVPTTGIDFSLDPSAKIQGEVRRTSGAPVGCWMSALEPDGALGDASSTSSGFYRFENLVQGEYFVKTYCSGFRDEVYDDILCLDPCDVTQGRPVQAWNGQTTKGVDFVLQAWGKITGSIRREIYGSAASFTLAQVLDLQGNLVAYSDYVDFTSRYSIGGLDAGTYLVRTDSLPYTGLYEEIFDDVVCSPTGCDLSRATPITVGLDETIRNIDFLVVSRSRISGIVRDDRTGLVPSTLGVSGVIHTWDEDGNLVASGTTSGLYRTPFLEPGVYYLTAEGFDFYEDQLYSRLPCQPGGCQVTEGTPIEVVDDAYVSDVDFFLQRKGRLAGRIRDRLTGLFLVGAEVSLFDENGNLLETTKSNFAGSYELRHLEFGRYFLTATASSTHLPELYKGIPCTEGCNPKLGAPLDLTLSKPQREVDFDLQPSGFEQ